jgi:hypothetical protein
MGSREEEKKQWELRQGAIVARAINEAEGADYEATFAMREPADVELKSAGGRFPTRGAQVVSIPLDFRSRDDKHTVRRLETLLEEALIERGMRHVLVGVIPSGAVEMHGASRLMVGRLADFIEREGRDRDAFYGYNEIYGHDHELGEMFHNINISHHPDLIDGVEIEIPRGGAVPLDGRWIEEGIRKKLLKYGGEAAVNDLALIIGVAGFVDDRQIAAFRRAFSESELPFAEIWINTQYHGTSCLKGRTAVVR